MYCTRELQKGMVWVGGSDRRLNLFENLFPLPHGVSYNAYVILDEKTAVIDTVDASIAQRFMENVLHTLDGRSPDYLVVNHMEPDHCAALAELLARFPHMALVGSAKTAAMLRQFQGEEAAARLTQVAEGDRLSLGAHTLRFIMAPMVHWPEVMMTYEESTGTLFSADAFGSFGALGGKLFSDELDVERQWLPEARRYYGNIVGKYGPQVQAALKKAADLELKMICPLHGPVWRQRLDYLLEKHRLWSAYQPEERAVAVIYGSMYGGTENAADIVATRLVEQGIHNVAVYDVSLTHVSDLIGEVFRCSHLVLAAPTYNGGIYPPMAELLHDMKALNLQNRTAALLENGTWAPVSGKQMRAALEELKDMRVLEAQVSVRSTVAPEGAAQLLALADSVAASVREEA